MWNENSNEGFNFQICGLVQVKSGELLRTPEMDNQQPS